MPNDKWIIGYGLVQWPWFLGFLFILLVICLSSLCMFFLSQKISKVFGIEHGSTKSTGYFSVIDSLMAFTISFVVVNAWLRYHDQVLRMEDEAIVISNMYRDSYGVDNPQGALIRANLRVYVDDLLTDGWRKLENGTECVKCREDINNLYRDVAGYEPSDKVEQILVRSLLGQIHELQQLRRLRLYDSQHPIVLNIFWVVIFCLILLTHVSAFIRHTVNRRQVLYFSGLYAFAVSLILFVGFHINFPYRGMNKLKPFALTAIKDESFRTADSIFLAKPIIRVLADNDSED
jgi:hypothetical protein